MPTSAASPVLRVLSGGALREILHELGDRYSRSSGVRVAADFATSAAVSDRVREGEAVDVVISTQPAIAELERLNRVAPGSAAILAKSGIGVAVRAGRAKPDISSVDAFKATLRAAKSIACANPVFRTPSGVFLAGLLERLQLAAELKAKLHLIGATGGHPIVVCEAVAKGEAEIGIQQISEIITVPGVELVGPLPAEIQHTTVFAVAVATTATDPDRARQFVGFLTSATAHPVITANGMTPE